MGYSSGKQSTSPPSYVQTLSPTIHRCIKAKNLDFLTSGPHSWDSLHSLPVARCVASLRRWRLQLIDFDLVPSRLGGRSTIGLLYSCSAAWLDSSADVFELREFAITDKRDLLWLCILCKTIPDFFLVMHACNSQLPFQKELLEI